MYRVLPGCKLAKPDGSYANEGTVVHGDFDRWLDKAVELVSFPIEGYEEMSAKEILPHLSTLNHEELEVVKAHELKDKNRKTVLSRVIQLLNGGSN